MITTRLRQATWLLAEVARRRDRWSTLHHPFHERWIAGELTEADLQTYAGEHHHVVTALAGMSRRAAALADGMLGEQLIQQAIDRELEIDLWCEFAIEAGWRGRSSSWYYAADPLPETTASTRIWAGGDDRSLAQHLVTIYALETAQAGTARLQLDALLGCYDFREDGCTEYFRRRCQGGDGPSGLIEAALTGLLSRSDAHPLVWQAELAYRAYWELLDGVERFSQASRPRHGADA